MQLVDINYSRLVLSKLQLLACCERVENYIHYGEGMLRSGMYGGACGAGYVIVLEAVSALYLSRCNLVWSPDSFRWELDKVGEEIGEQDELYKTALELLAFPRILDEDAAREYFNRCIAYAIDKVGIRGVGVPSAHYGTQQYREPRYDFRRQWGRRALELGMSTKLEAWRIHATLAGGRGSVDIGSQTIP